jgi:hypothetical protein
MSDSAWVGALARYQRAMVEGAQAHLLPLTDDVRTRASQGLGALLFGAASSNPMPPTALRRDEVVFQKLFYGFMEITEAFDMLRDAEVYLRSLPRKRLIPPNRFMRYHITNFHNNAYILSQRLDQYATTVERSYRKASHVAKIKGTISKLKRIASEGMKSIIAKRGGYVHQSHFTDDHFERLSVTALLGALRESYDDHEFAENMARLHEVSFRRARKEWLDKLASHNNYISKLLDAYFHLIHSVVCDEDDHIIYPVHHAHHLIEPQ